MEKVVRVFNNIFGSCTIRIEPAVVEFGAPPSQVNIFLTNLGGTKVVCSLKVTEFDFLRASPIKFYLNPDEKKKVKLQFIQYDPELFTLSKTESSDKYPMWFVFAFAQTFKYNSEEDHIFAMPDASAAEFCRIVPDDQWTMHILDIDLPPGVTKEPPRKKTKDTYSEVVVPYTSIQRDS